jgi:hypothetical protein
MNANTLLAGLAAVAVASSAAAQQVPRTPPPAFAALRPATPGQPPPADSVPPLGLPQPMPVVPAAAAVVDDGPPAFNSEAAKSFAARIQPVLANACAGCHARKDHASKFKMRYTSGEYVDHEATTANLHAVVRMISRDKPSESVLLAKAVTGHGGAKDPPLRSRTITAFRNLETWAHWAAAAEGAGIPDSVPTLPAAAVVPQLPHANPPSIPSLTPGLKEPKPPAEPAPPAAGAATHLVLGPKEPGKLPPLPKAEPVPPGGFAAGPRPTASDPTKPNPADEFDPAAFNRAMHPMKK